MKKMNVYKMGYKVKGKATPEDDYIWLKAANVKEAKEGARSFVWLRLHNEGKKGAIQINKYMESLTFFVIKRV